MLDITLLRRDLDAVLARLQTRKNPQPFLDADAFRSGRGRLHAAAALTDAEGFLDAFRQTHAYLRFAAASRCGKLVHRAAAATLLG